MTRRSPLPVRRGVNATRLRVPLTGPWETIHAYVLETFSHLDPASITGRFDSDEVVDAHGRPLSTTTALGAAEFIWYYRTLPQEPVLPVTERILYEDEHLVVADKPHFLPTTPAGRYVQQSLLVRLRNSLGLDELTPIHRLDRGTAGLVLFAKQPATRGKYQQLFENQQVSKTYECISPLADGVDPQNLAERFPLTVRSRIRKTKGVVVSERIPYPVADSGRRPEHRRLPRRGPRRTQPAAGANSASRVELLGAGTNRHHDDVGRFRLTPHTGKTHQLRIHMALLGLGIMHDRFYPQLFPDAPDNFDAPLQLLAAALSFTDPLTGRHREFRSDRRLVEAPQ
ncbi:MAG: pseudouridine synthase [Nesterenkonia sp.]